MYGPLTNGRDMKTGFPSLLGSCLLLSACSTGGQKFTQSGFLGGYERLSRSQEHGNVAFWLAADYRAAQYDSVALAPVTWLAPHRKEAVEQRLKEELSGSLREILSRRYHIVDPAEAGSRTLVVRAAITDTRRTRWYLNAPAQVATTLTLGGLSVLAPLQGGASVEIDVSGNEGRVPVAQLSFYRNGKPWNFKGSYVAYDHARLAFKVAAERIDEVLAGQLVAK